MTCTNVLAMFYFFAFIFVFSLSCVWQLQNKRIYNDDADAVIFTFWPNQHVSGAGTFMTNLVKIFAKILYSPSFSSDLDLWPMTWKANQHICEPNICVTKIGWNSLHWIVRYGAHRVIGSLPAVTLTFDICTKNWSAHLRAAKHIWPKLSEIPFIGLWDIVFTRSSGQCSLWHWPVIIWPRKIIRACRNTNTSVTKNGRNSHH